MRFIDHLRLNPMCFDGSTGKVDFDASDLIDGTTVFDVSEVADQLIECSTITPSGARQAYLTANGQEWAKLLPTADGKQNILDYGKYIGIIPPFDNCFFEYPAAKDEPTATDAGVHVASMSKRWIAAKYPDQTYEFVMLVTVFYHFITNGIALTGRETVATIASDGIGRVLLFDVAACLTTAHDRSLPENQPLWTPLIVLLVSLMMLNCRLLKSTSVEPPPKSRQQRRYEDRHPQRATPPLVRYYTLEVDLEKTQSHSAGPSKRGGWEQAWHLVRGFLRRTKFGKVVAVRPHTRGNPLKGIIVKDYKAKVNQGSAA